MIVDMTVSGDVCFFYMVLFFFKQKTAYEMRISDLSSDVCSSDLRRRHPGRERARAALVKSIEGQIDDLADIAFAGRRFGHFPADRRAHGFGLIGGERLLQPRGAADRKRVV